MGDADAVTALEQAASEYERARERVEDVGEERLRRCAEVYRELSKLLEGYRDRATGSGDFQGFMEFQSEVARVADDLPEDLPERETFEEVDDYLQQRRLTESDFETARTKLAPVEELVGRLDELAESRERYEKARLDARRRLEDVEDRIAELEDLQRLGDADLDAPVERLREPIEAYDEAAREAFRAFRSDAPAREVFDALARADAYPLVDVRTPPSDLREYVETHEPGTEPIPTLLEYADYSASKLDHYVDDPAALTSAVATRRTYLRGLDAEPLTIGWPPPPADHLPWLCREYRAVLARFADEAVIAKLRRVRDLASREDYQRLRESAVARAELTAEQRDRLASGAVADELAAAREEKQAIADALAEHDGV